MHCPTCGSPVKPTAGTTPQEIVSDLGVLLGDIEAWARDSRALDIRILDAAQNGQALIITALNATRPVVEVAGP